MPFNTMKRLFLRSTGLVLFLIAIGFFSCKTPKPVQESVVSNTGNITSEKELLQKIDSSQHTYTNLNIKFAAKAKIGKDENSLRGKLKICQDSCVWVSALPLGIEAARIIATKNEAGLINFLKRNYFLGGYDLLSSQIGYSVNYDMLETILTGEPLFIADKTTYRLANDKKNTYYFSPYEKDDFEKISNGKQMPSANTVQALWFTDDVLLSKNILYDVPQKRYLEINYSNYTLVGKDRIPFGITVEIKTPKETAFFEIEYTKVEADQTEMEYPFTIPDSYEKMELK